MPPLVLPPVPGARAAFDRLLQAAPCLHAQVDVPARAAGIVHLCEVTLGERISSRNVYRAFLIQYPEEYPDYTFTYPPIRTAVSGGDVMESLCSEVLENEGTPHMQLDAAGWPVWQAPGHISLNRGQFKALKLYGDLMIPTAPHNLLISVKSEAARERFVLSGNRLESVGFGFFSDPSEFWTASRISVLKRWGFMAVYFPTPTYRRLKRALDGRQGRGKWATAVNTNGNPLFRPIRSFGADMRAVAGKHTFLL